MRAYITYCVRRLRKERQKIPKPPKKPNASEPVHTLHNASITLKQRSNTHLCKPKLPLTQKNGRQLAHVLETPHTLGCESWYDEGVAGRG